MRTAPVLVLVWTAPGAYLDRYAQADKGWTDRDPARWTAPYWHVDAGMSVLAMLYAAVDAGLGACFFGVPPNRIAAVADGVRGSRRSGARRRGQSRGSGRIEDKVTARTSVDGRIGPSRALETHVTPHFVTIWARVGQTVMLP